MIKFGIKDVDRGWKMLKRIAKDLERNPLVAKVGVLDDGGKGSEVREGGFTNTEIAAVQEFGAPNVPIPERSFMRSTYDEKLPTLITMMGKAINQIIDGRMTSDKALNIAGAYLATEMKKKITEGDPIPPPNAPSTLRRKLALSRPGATGEVRTLVDTGRMVQSISWKVVKDDGAK